MTIIPRLLPREIGGAAISRGLLILLFGLPAAAAAQTREESRIEVVGEAFGTLVRAEEFAYHYKTAALLTRTGKQEQRTDDEIRQEAWENLLFVRESDRLGITIPRSELEEELKRLLADKQVRYGTPEYAEWARSTLKEDAPIFEKRLEGLLRINKLLKMKTDPNVAVTEEEMLQKYLNQYNSFESEYVCFGSREDAEAFLARVQQDRSLWKPTFDRVKAEQGQKGAAWINIMALEALMDLWKIPKDDAYRIMGMQEGDFAVATQHYGDCVFRILTLRPTSEQDFDEKKREYYRNLLTTVKKQQAARAYLEDLRARAQVRDYEQERRAGEERRKQAADAEQLKPRSRILLQTSQGDVEVKLWPDVAPKACENFITLVERGSYNGLTFHRVIKDFMIQGGDPKGDGTGGESVWGKPFEDEVRDDVKFDRPGLLAMANSGPNTNGSQFFITTVPTPWLNGKHTIFGEVVSGMDVVKRLSEVKVDSANKPLEPQRILKASIQPSTDSR